MPDTAPKEVIRDTFRSTYGEMAAVAQQPSAASTSQGVNLTNGHTESPDTLPPPAPAAATNKKGKGKKDKYGPDETSKLLAAKISQLEQDAAGEKDQEAEIGTYPSCPS